MKGISLPGFGGAVAIASIDLVIVAVNREVWRCSGRARNKSARSEENVGVRSRSASSSTC